jgi:hypothetical protein
MLFQHDPNATRPPNDVHDADSPGPRTRIKNVPRLISVNDAHEVSITRSLNNTSDRTTDTPDTPNAADKSPAVLPGQRGRLNQQHNPIVLSGILIGSIVVFILATLFVVPSHVVPSPKEQHSQSLAQSVNDWFKGNPIIINLAEHVDPPTPTPALRTIEGYCGGSDIWGTCATAITASHVMGTGHMQRPIRGAIITQVFGHPEYQAWCGCWKPHTGIDLAAPYGTPVMAADSGQVIWTGWDWSGLGWAVKINHGHYIATIYGHLQRFIVSTGQNVTKGQIIAYEGSTGASTGPHVHFMVLYNNIWVNPADYVQLP